MRKQVVPLPLYNLSTTYDDFEMSMKMLHIPYCIIICTYGEELLHICSIFYFALFIQNNKHESKFTKRARKVQLQKSDMHGAEMQTEDEGRATEI